jgi:predicted P-loop ATPase
MNLKYNRAITLSVAGSRKSTFWKPWLTTVQELYEKLERPVRSTETQQEYRAMRKPQQDDLKDVGGFVGGGLSAGHRKANNLTGREVITLDFDNIPGWQTELVINKMEELNCSYCLYSTRKHTPGAPRLRVVIPFDRTVSPDEYEPCARRVAAHIGIDMADPTTFEACRLMYWPSCCSDGEYIYQYKDAPLISADFLLSTYVDWHNYLSWPQVPNAVSYQKLAMKQGDPTEKGGVVGAFCRTYDVFSAMETFLPEIYDPVDTDPNRYTYLGGSTTGGAVIYDNGKFLYSHHATDPCSGRLVNAFDLVRLHKFGDKDQDAAPDTPVAKLPSYKAMCELAMEDKATIATLNREQMEQARRDFEGLEQEPENKDDVTWAERLQRTQDGKVKNTIDNVLIILNGDPQLKGKFALNKFAGRGEVLGELPWEKSAVRRLWSDTDSNGLYWYLERNWGITKRGNIDSALDIHASEHAFNEVQDFINGLRWDGTPRLDTLFIDYLGAADTAYNRSVCRKAFTAAVARAMLPGCKFDNMLILSGPQGIGKSTLLDRMSKGWFNDSIRTFEGKDASELLQGVWLVEVSELDAFRRTDVARIKQFLSLRADRYRAAYGRHVKELPRCCVFFGSTNTTDFLQDTTGNRRFWPVDVGEQPRKKTVWNDLTDDVVTQLWAEAKVRWQSGEQLYLTGLVEEEAKLKQEEHREVSVREGLIEAFAGKQVPTDWAKWPIDRRKDFWCGAIRTPDGAELELVERDRIAAVEVWCELFGGNIKDMKPADTREINAILARLEGWRRSEKVIRVGPYSVQRGFVRK